MSGQFKKPNYCLIVTPLHFIYEVHVYLLYFILSNIHIPIKLQNKPPFCTFPIFLTVPFITFTIFHARSIHFKWFSTGYLTLKFICVCVHSLYFHCILVYFYCVYTLYAANDQVVIAEDISKLHG